MICPYCHRHCTGDDLLMQCGPRCPAIPPFPAKVLRHNRCPHGRLPQPRRLCPACARRVPREYAEGPSHTILVTGAPRSGRSTWLAELLRRLSTGEVAHTVPGLSTRLLGDHASPVLISLRRANTAPVVLALHELSAEDIPPTAAGVVHLVDPAHLPGVRTLFGWSAEPPPATPAWPPHLPVAVTLSKLDLVWDAVEPGSPLRRPSPHATAYVEPDGLDVHHEVTAWLARWGGAPPPPRHRCFALSARSAGYRVADPLLWLLATFGAYGVARS